MKRIGIFLGAVVVAFALMVSNADNTIFAGGSCCGVKESDKECSKKDAEECAKNASHGEKTGDECAVCGKVGNKDNQVNVEHAGKTEHLCCQGCANAYNEDPGKYSKAEVEPVPPRRTIPAKKEMPKRRKQPGGGYH